MRRVWFRTVGSLVLWVVCWFIIGLFGLTIATIIGVPHPWAAGVLCSCIFVAVAAPFMDSWKWRERK